jgi:hypothetical protein
MRVRGSPLMVGDARRDTTALEDIRVLVVGDDQRRD